MKRTMLIRYVGKKPLPYTLSLPIPFTVASDKVGEVVFNPDGAVPDQYCDFLLTNCGGSFVRIRTEIDDFEEQDAREPEPGKGQLRSMYTFSKRLYSGKAGKWEALRHIRERKLTKFVELTRTPYGWRIVPRSAEYLARAAQLMAVSAHPAESQEEAQDDPSRDGNSDDGANRDAFDGDTSGAADGESRETLVGSGTTQDRQSA